MATLHISEDVEARLASAAKRAGRTTEELAEEILSSHLEDLIALTPEQMERLRQSSEQIGRGEYVTSEEVEKFLDEWQAELDAR